MFRRATLENGIRIVTERMPASRSVALGILVGAGPRDEPPGRNGLAHLSEHALFQGTSGRSAFEIARLMDVAGGQMGAFTARDYTCFHANVLDEYCTYATDLFGDMLLNSTFDAEHVEREKQAILREIGQNDDNPADRAHARLKQLIWPEHPLGRAVQGDPDSLADLTCHDTRAFVQTNYTPDRIIVSAAGNLDHDAIVEQVRDAFWRLSGSAPPRLASRCRFRSGLAFDIRDVSQAYFAIGLPAPNYAAADRYRLFLLNSVLGGGLSSRLYRKLREERGLVYHISSELHAYSDAGAWVIEGSTSPEHLSAVIALTMLELQQLATFAAPINEEELWTARMQVRAQHLIASETAHTRMSRLATQELYFGRQISEAEILEGIEHVTIDDLRQTCAKRWQPALDQVAVSVVGPEASESYSADSLRELLGEVALVAA